MVQKHRGEYPSSPAAIKSIAPKIGCVAQTLLAWVKQAEVEAGTRSGAPSATADRVAGPSVGLMVGEVNGFGSSDLRLAANRLSAQAVRVSHIARALHLQRC